MSKYADQKRLLKRKLREIDAFLKVAAGRWSKLEAKISKYHRLLDRAEQDYTIINDKAAKANDEWLTVNAKLERVLKNEKKTKGGRK